MNTNKPNVSVKFQNEELKVLELHGSEGNVLPNHKVNIPATLKVTKGEVLYKEGEKEISLRTDNYKLIPKNVVHNLTFIEESVVELILLSSSKFQFTDS